MRAGVLLQATQRVAKPLDSSKIKQPNTCPKPQQHGQKGERFGLDQYYDLPAQSIP